MGQQRPLDGKLAIVTGASRGIGAAICSNLAGKGCNLVMNFTSESSKQKTGDLASRLAETHGIKAVPVQADVGSPTSGNIIVQAVKEHFTSSTSAHATAQTTPQVDIVINNAGVAGNQKLGEITAEEFHRQYAVNVLGPLMLMQAVQPHLPSDRSGRVVNVSSVSASLGFPAQSVYGGTKAALEAMTRTWSRELGERCTVNAINPGPVETDMYGGTTQEFQKHMKSWIEVTPGAQVSVERDGEERTREFAPKGGRPATAEEIAGIVGMLCNSESAWCTGSVISCNGGMRFSP